jgi:transmembrane sensor
MSDPEAVPGTEDQLLREAAAWFARMRGQDAEASRSEFEAWLARGALHRAAYNRAAEIFAMGKLLAEPDPPRMAAATGERSRGRRPVLTALVALSVVGGASWLALTSGDAPQGATDKVAGSAGPQGEYSARLITVASEMRSVRMPEGSEVRLEADTIVAVRFQGAARSLVLERGRARFTVAREARPFVVEVGGGRVTALGTIFEVSLDNGRRVTVRLVEGAVDVIPAATAEAPRPQPRRMARGETLTFASTPQAGAQAAGAAEEAASPSVGPQPAPQEYDRIRIADLILAANRRAPRPIRLADPAIGERRVSGWFRVDDANLLAERIATLFDLRIDLSHPAEIVLWPGSQ